MSTCSTNRRPWLRSDAQPIRRSRVDLGASTGRGRQMTSARRLSRRGFATAALAASVAGGLARRSRAQEEPQRGGTLVATWGGGEPQTCYVPTGGGPGPTLTSSKLFERLAARNAGGHFEGRLAESWKPAADFKSYTIKLRQGVRFHDGKPMTADDVAYSI